MFKKLHINNWRQFRFIDIEFHRRLTILTGANGAGKTSLLHLLNRHWGWNLNYVSTPRYTRKGLKKYWTGFWGGEFEESNQQNQQSQLPIGRIEYMELNRPLAELTVPHQVNEAFNVNIQPMHNLYGVYVPSHRPLYIHQPVTQIPTQVDAKQQIFDRYFTELRNRFAINQRVTSPSHQVKQALISLATFGYGNRAVQTNVDALRTFEGFEEILRTMLPQSLGFRSIRIQVPDVILDTQSGEFAFDAVSGGVAALIDVSWQVYMYSLLHDEFVVVIDEPEAHLHPELQKRILPNLLEAFPRAQFVVATHNPFVVSSTPNSNVYVLNYDNERRVNSELLNTVDKAGTSNDILREVLGVDVTMPLWVDRRLGEIVERYAQSTIDEQSFARLRQELTNLGLSRFIPETIAGVVDESQRND